MADRVPASVKAAYLDVLHRARWRRYPVRRITLAFSKEHGRTVIDGPFRGLRFPKFAIGRGEMVVPQLVGSYERELQPFFEEIAAQEIEQVVDVGASDGYYAVGLAR